LTQSGHAARRNLFFSWTFDFVIDDFSRFRKRLGGGCAWVRDGQLQAVLIVYGNDETGLARQIEPMKIINSGLEDHGLLMPHRANDSRRTGNLSIY
jgi:hypothetical protein